MTGQTYTRWPEHYDRTETDQLEELNRLEKANERLRKVVSDLTLDTRILEEAARGAAPAVAQHIL